MKTPRKEINPNDPRKPQKEYRRNNPDKRNDERKKNYQKNDFKDYEDQKEWTPNEECLVNTWPKNDADLAAHLNRSVQSIQTKRARMKRRAKGIRRSDE